MSSEKILNLKLFYKGKNLDVARENRDIKDKFFIGSDKHMQWQILDESFPKRYLLVRKAKDSYNMFIQKGMQLTVNKGNETLNENELKSKKMLKGNTLQLEKDFTGAISFSNDWKIEFEYVKPYVAVLTEEDKRLVALYHRRPPLSSQEKLARNFLLIVVLLALIGGMLFDKYYIPPQYERSLASRIIVDIPIQEPTIPDYVVNETPIEPEPIVDTEPTTPSKGGGRPASAASVLGFKPGTGGSGTGGPSSAIAKGPSVMTYSEQIVGRGTGGGGSGPGRGAGGGSAGIAGRAGSSFDVGGAPTSTIAPGTLFKGDIDAAKRMGMRDVDASVLGGVTGEIKATEITSASQLQALAQARARAESAGLQTVDEASIESAAPELKDDLINIRQYIQPNLRQLDDLFKQETQIRKIYGSVLITLYFARDGRVEAVDIEERAGSFFTESFKNRARDIMMQWRVPTKKQLPPYRFPYRFH